MASDGEARDVREVRLEGGVLLVAGGILLALVVAAFQLGRWVERWTAPERSAAPAADPLANVEEEAVTSTERLKFFDTLSGEGVQAEPKRETRVPSAPPSAATVRPPETSAGAWFVQVFAGRDRGAAEVVVKRLQDRGLPVRFDRQREGGTDALYKVRVGGFPTREAADAAAVRLKKEGHPSAWVTKLPG